MRFGGLELHVLVADVLNQLGKSVGDHVRVVYAGLFAVLLDDAGRDEHAVGGHVARKQDAVGVVNRAAIRFNHGLRGDLTDDLGLIFFILHGLKQQDAEQQ